MSEDKVSCVQPVAGPAQPSSSEPATTGEEPSDREEAAVATARVGQVAPDFEARAFVEGGFKTIKLSDYRGKWVILCFYPGDFTFV